MTNTLFQLRTSDSIERVYSHLRVEHSENSLTDLLYVKEDDGTQSTTSIALNTKQWHELALFAAGRAAALLYHEQDMDKEPSSKHMGNRQVENMQEQNRIAVFEEKISLTRQEFYDVGGFGLRAWPFDTEVIAALVERNEIVDTGVRVTPDGKTLYKITPKGKTQHRRFLGEED